MKVRSLRAFFDIPCCTNPINLVTTGAVLHHDWLRVMTIAQTGNAPAIKISVGTVWNIDIE
jgi:hypothetical protein